MQKKYCNSDHIGFDLGIVLLFCYSDASYLHPFIYCSFPLRVCRWYNVVIYCCIAKTEPESMDGKGCLKSVFSSTRKVNLSISRMSKKRYFVLSRISLVNGGFMDYATILESAINFAMGLK